MHVDIFIVPSLRSDARMESGPALIADPAYQTADAKGKDSVTQTTRSE